MGLPPKHPVSSKPKYSAEERAAARERLTKPRNDDAWTEKARAKMLRANRKPRTNTIDGMFSEVMPLCSGDTFREANAAIKSSRWKGSRFRTGGKLKKGKCGPGVFLSGCPRLCIGDPYMDPSERRRKYAREKKKKLALKTEDGEEMPPFRPSGRTKRRKDLYLSAVDSESSKADVRKAYDAARKAKLIRAKQLRQKFKDNEGNMPTAPRNFYTAPSKKGSYGVVGITLSEKTAWGRKTLAYMHDPYENRRLNARKEKLELIAKRGDRPPFAVRACKNDLASLAKRGGGAKTARRPEGESPNKGKGARPGSAPPRRRRGGDGGDGEDELPPWRPSNSGKKSACVSKFPAWVSDPVPESKFKKRDAGEDDANFKAWMPCSGHRTRVSPSVTLNRRNVRRLTGSRSIGGVRK